jgi:hypothetical protein
MDGSMEKNCALILTILIALALPGIAEEGPQVDFILLIDTSLSMSPAIEEVKQYVAGGVVGRFVQQGDWVAVLAFYGKSTLIWEGEIQTEADKASLIRSLHALEAKGRFTDIGMALDDMKQLVIQRNRPEIPKYILLLTDEIQEAPPDSSYRSDDFTVDHELLEYVRRVDMGSFHAITIGYGLANRIESDLESLMKTLNDPPDRPERFLPGGESTRGQDTSTAGGFSTQDKPSITTGGQDGTGQTLSASPGSVASGTSSDGIPPDGSQPGANDGRSFGVGGISKTSIYIILGLVIGTAILGVVLITRRKSQKSRNPVGYRKPSEEEDKDKPSGSKDGKQ